MGRRFRGTFRSKSATNQKGRRLPSFLVCTSLLLCGGQRGAQVSDAFSTPSTTTRKQSGKSPPADGSGGAKVADQRNNAKGPSSRGSSWRPHYFSKQRRSSSKLSAVAIEPTARAETSSESHGAPATRNLAKGKGPTFRSVGSPSIVVKVSTKAKENDDPVVATHQAPLPAVNGARMAAMTVGRAHVTEAVELDEVEQDNDAMEPSLETEDTEILAEEDDNAKEASLESEDMETVSTEDMETVSTEDTETVSTEDMETEDIETFSTAEGEVKVQPSMELEETESVSTEEGSDTMAPPLELEETEIISLQDDGKELLEVEEQEEPKSKGSRDSSTPSTWLGRNARSAEEGIRREKSLSSLLENAASGVSSRVSRPKGRPFAARTINGLIHALADEVSDLDVQVDARSDTPLSRKEVDAVRIRFSRLGFKPLRMGGHDQSMNKQQKSHDGKADGCLATPEDERAGGGLSSSFHALETKLKDLSCADTAFKSLDSDNSGTLDRHELARALGMVASAASSSSSPRGTTTSGQTDSQSFTAPWDEDEQNQVNDVGSLELFDDLASDLVQLYDFNGDGVVDRSEYQCMVEDMATLREAQMDRQRALERRERKRELRRRKNKVKEKAAAARGGWFSSVKNFVGWRSNNGEEFVQEGADADDPADDPVDVDDQNVADIFNVTETAEELDSMAKALGSITLSDLKVDLRRLVFGAVPVLKHITPGGPLILEPFTVTFAGSFSRSDIMNSSLLDAGLRMLVARALRRRLRSFRDALDMAVFYGRSWKMDSKSAPLVEVPELTNVEFDGLKLVITGRAKLRASQEDPIVEQAFKVRTSIGTHQGGRVIRLVEPELALVLECPERWEENILNLYRAVGREIPCRPDPMYFFFPIYSPFKVRDKDGFDLGQDNCIKSIYVQDGALRFELSAVLRPGRFLGNHYVAFTVPMRTFIITLDRVKEGIRAARKMKRASRALENATKNQTPSKVLTKSPAQRNGAVVPPPSHYPHHHHQPRFQTKSFFSRFVDGYLQLERDDETNNAHVTSAIQDWFGRQGSIDECDVIPEDAGSTSDSSKG